MDHTLLCLTTTKNKSTDNLQSACSCCGDNMMNDYVNNIKCSEDNLKYWIRLSCGHMYMHMETHHLVTLYTVPYGTVYRVTK